MADEMITFADAVVLVDEPILHIENLQAILLEHAERTYTTATAAMTALSAGVEKPVLERPELSAENWLYEPVQTPANIGWPGFEHYDPIDLGAAPDVTGVTMDDVGDAPTWDDKPNVALSMPPNPNEMDLSNKPFKPPADFTYTPPPAQVFTAPVMDPLDQIDIPTFAGVDLPTFDGKAPDETGLTPISPTTTWSEPDYIPEILPEIKLVIEAMLTGKGLPAAVEQALFDRAAVREDVIAQQAVQEAFDVFAGRGFTMPPGMLAAQVDIATQKALLAKNTLSRDIMAKQWELHYENLKFAVAQGLAYEQLLVTIWDNMLKRTFEMAKVRVDAELRLYDAAVGLYNARLNAYKIGADVFRIKLEAELSEIEIFKAKLDGEKIKNEVNTTRANIFATRSQALVSQVEAYKAQIHAATAHLEAARLQMDGYKTEVEAWVAGIDAQKATYEAYKTRVDAERAKIDILQASAQAFAAEVSAYTSVVGAKSKKADVQLAVIDAKMKAFGIQMEERKLKVEKTTAVNRADIDYFAAQLDKVKTDAGVYIANAKNKNEAIELRLRNNIEFFTTKQKQYEVEMANFFKLVELNKASLQQVSSSSAAIAQGALSAIHASSSLSGSASTSAGYTESFSTP